MDRENSDVKMEMQTRGAEMSEHYECPNCNYRITVFDATNIQRYRTLGHSRAAIKPNAAEEGTE